MRIVGVSLVSILVSTAAYAETFFKPYIGVDYMYTSVDYESNIGGSGINGDDIAEDSLHGGNIHVGAKLHKNFGVEAGYMMTAEEDKTNVLGSGVNTTTSFSGFTLDALGYLPVAEKVELIGTLGASYLTGEIEFSAAGLGTEAVDESEFKGRFGAGAQYWISEKTNVRALVRYQDADFDGSTKGAVITTVGLNLSY